MDCLLKANLKLFVFLLAACFSLKVSAAPQLVQYTGLLTDNLGTPLSNGDYQVQFKLYDSSSSGNILWSEAWDGSDGRHPKVSVLNGRFMVLLGSNTADGLPSSIFQEENTVFLGVKVGSDPEMIPRQRISSVPYSLTSDDGVPSGGIIMWSGTAVPEGWALCDGTQGAPDLRNRFVIGAGGSFSAGDEGGSATKNMSHSHAGASHTHSGPSHTHSVAHSHYVTRVNDGTALSESGHGLDNGADFAGKTMNGPTNSGAGGTNQTGAGGTGNTSVAGNTSQDIMPPYYALAFIMKL